MGTLSEPLRAGLGRPLCFRLRQVRRDSSAPPHCGGLCFYPQAPGPSRSRRRKPAPVLRGPGAPEPKVKEECESPTKVNAMVGPDPKGGL